MILTNYSRGETVTHTYIFEDGKRTYTLKESFSDGKLVDATVLDENVLSYDNPDLLKQLQNLADEETLRENCLP
jgi:hypothetical protein